MAKIAEKYTPPQPRRAPAPSSAKAEAASLPAAPSNDDVLTQTVADDEIRKIIFQEKTQWENATVWVTEKVAFNMREVIKRCRKNYYGIFDEPNDPDTGLEKTWVPLTEWVVETVVKNVDLDTKDLNVRARRPRAYGGAAAMRHILFWVFWKILLGEMLDKWTRDLAIDGTVVTKTLEKFRQNEFFLQVRQPDILNLYYDPAADTLAKTTVIERAVLTIDEVKAYEGRWRNIDGVRGTIGQLHTTSDKFQQITGSVPQVEIYERWGKIRKAFVTLKKTDWDTWVEGVLIVSGRGEKGSIVHKAMLNPKKDGRKPYEEVRLKRVPARHAGRGIAEMLIGLQEWVNIIVGTRKTNNLLKQRGLFKIRKGSGITAATIARLSIGGAFQVKKMDDIEEFDMRDISATTYKDEEVAYRMSERVTGAFEISRGETLPSSMPATNAAIQNANSKSTFVLIQEQIGMFLQRLVVNQIVPIVAERLTDGEILNILGDPEELRTFDELVVEARFRLEALKYVERDGWAPLPDEQEEMRRAIRDEIVRGGRERFVQYRTAVLAEPYDIHYFFTNEDIDKATMITNLREMLTAYARLPGSRLDPDMIIKEILDLMGMGGERFFRKEEHKMPAEISGVAQALPAPQGQAIPTDVTEFQRSNIRPLATVR